MLGMRSSHKEVTSASTEPVSKCLSSTDMHSEVDTQAYEHTLCRCEDKEDG